MNLKPYLLPGLVFQAAVVGAGYATGRELVEFFMQGSVLSGLLGLGVAALVWGAVIAVAFENARMLQATDYRTFLKGVTGPLWVGYEICFAALLILILSVLGSAAGEIVRNELGIAPIVGTVAMMACICCLLFYGTGLIEKFLAFWSVILYVLFALILVLSVAKFPTEISASVNSSDVSSGWFTNGLSYAGYNLAVLPGILYCTRHLPDRKTALISGLMAGMIAIVPAILFFIAMTAFWPDIRSSSLPIEVVLDGLNFPILSAAFYIALFGIFIKTGVALIHAVNERIAATFAEKGTPLPKWGRPAIAIVLLFIALVLAGKFGLIALIGSGYRLLTIAFLAIFVFPMLIIGGFRILKGRSAAGGREAIKADELRAPAE